MPPAYNKDACLPAEPTMTGMAIGPADPTMTGLAMGPADPTRTGCAVGPLRRKRREKTVRII